MDKQAPEAMIQEMKRLTNKLNDLTTNVKVLNAKIEEVQNSEKRLYEFVNTAIDKMIQYQEKLRLSRKCLS